LESKHALNIAPDEESGELLPDLNEQPADDGDDMHHLQEDEVHQLTEGQSHYLQEEEHASDHAIDLNVPACQEYEEFNQGNVSLNTIPYK
jgi:hypothetical protein